MQVAETKSYTITLSPEEMDTLIRGLGNTSVTTRESAGMTEEQARFFSKLYDVYTEFKLKNSY